MAIPAGPFARYRASQLALSDSDPVGTWTDEGSGGNDLTQTGTARPTFEAAGFNGNASVLFDGSDDHVQTAAYSAAETQPNSIVIMGEMVAVSSTAANQLCDGRSDGRHAIISRGEQAGDPVGLFAGSINNATLSLVGTEGDDFCMVAIFNGATSELHYNNGGDVYNDEVGSQDLTGFTLGSRFDGDATSATANMRVVEVLVYDRALDSTELTDLQDYFQATYVDTSGGSQASVDVTAEGSGLKAISGGVAAEVAVTALGGGTSARSGGSTADVTITAAALGTAARSGGSETTVLVTVGDSTAPESIVTATGTYAPTVAASGTHDLIVEAEGAL